MQQQLRFSYIVAWIIIMDNKTYKSNIFKRQSTNDTRRQNESSVFFITKPAKMISNFHDNIQKYSAFQLLLIIKLLL